MSNFANRFKQARINAGVSIASIAKEMGISVQSVYGWAEGSIPKAERIERLAELLGVSLQWLAFGEGEIKA
ncbi:helix-turn-helix domain-containing protein, partial [Sutterella wadsworthensis]